MRRLIVLTVALAWLACGCQTDKSAKGDLPIVKAASQAAAKRGTVFLKVFVDDDAKAKTPVDMQVAIDDKPLINRSFSFGRDSYDGQYQITLPKGRHTLSAVSNRGNVQVQKSFRVKDRQFIELYVTDNGRWRLTPASKARILRFVIKTYRNPQTKTFNPAMWMRLSRDLPDDSVRPEPKTLRRYAQEESPALTRVCVTTREANG